MCPPPMYGTLIAQVIKWSPPQLLKEIRAVSTAAQLEASKSEFLVLYHYGKYDIIMKLFEADFPLHPHIDIEKVFRAVVPALEVHSLRHTYPEVG